MVAFFYKFIFFIKMEIYKELMIDFENPSTLTIPGFKKHEEIWEVVIHQIKYLL